MEKPSVATPDLSHHLSEVAKARKVSPVKGLFKYIEKNPGILNLAGGVPSPAYFPFANIGGDVLNPDTFLEAKPSSTASFSWLWSLLGFGSQGKEHTTHITVNKYAKDKNDVNLASALQYGTATGLVPLQEFIRNFTRQVFKPAYSNYATLVDVGNTDGWSKVALTLMNPGEAFLCEEWTYPSALSMAAPFGMTPIPIKADYQGMQSDDLENMLENWDVGTRGHLRPRIIYTVPIGQNPTGANMLSDRKKAIYDICVKYDVIIVEDDPYYFLQEGRYVVKHLREKPLHSSSTDEDTANALFLDRLAPSYLRFDYQGRVVRLDTFSKTIAPGSRMGWITSNPVFSERFERQGETTTQCPSGFSQALITQLLAKEWTYRHYVTWLRGLQIEYTARRDAIVDLFVNQFHMKKSSSAGVWNDADVYTGYIESGTDSHYAEKVIEKPLLSLIPPEAGMFVWIRIHTDSLPKLEVTPNDPELDTREKVLWDKLAEAGLLIGPGYLFSADSQDERLRNEAHFRMSFSFADRDTMKGAVKTIALVLEQLCKVDRR